MANTIRIGATEIAMAEDTGWTLNTGTFIPDVPREQWLRYLPDLPDSGEVHARVMTYVVRSQGKTILVDAGVGLWDLPNFGNGHLLDSLKALDVSPEEVDVVMPTHLHVDHVGWNTRPTADGPVPTFPRARYLFQQRDWDHFTSEAYLNTVPKAGSTAGPTMIRNCVLPLENSGLMELIGSEHKVTDEVSLVHAPGHTPGQVCVLVQSQGEAAILIGDVCHHPIQMTETDWTPLIDVDRDLSARSRRAVATMAKQLHGVVAGAHFNAPGETPFGTLIEIEGRTYWRGVDL